MNEAKLDKMLSCIYEFYPGLAGEHGKTIFSLGDFSKKSIDEFVKTILNYRESFVQDIVSNFLVVKLIEDRIYELEIGTYKSQTYFYYGRAFLTLFESLTTTQDLNTNRQLFIKRLQFLEKIVSQAYENLENQLLSRMEIISTRKQFMNTCQKIEINASNLLDERYYSAKIKFKELLDDKLKVVKRTFPDIKKESFVYSVERCCDNLFSVEDINMKLTELLKKLSVDVRVGESNSKTISQKYLTLACLNEYINSIIDMFGCLDKVDKEFDISELIVSNSHYKEQTQNYRALISFSGDECATLHINTNLVNDEEQLIDVIIHEIVPGHYFMSRFYSDKVNRLFKETSFWEGWAMLCEYHSLFVIDRETYRRKISRKLYNEVLIGIISLRLWYYRQSSEAISSWLQSDIGLQKNVADRLILTAILQYEERMPYFVGFSTFSILYDRLGFEELLSKVMLSGASFFHVNKSIKLEENKNE